MACETPPNAPWTPTERVAMFALIIWPLLFAALVAALCGGCRAFYENSGSEIEVGEITAPMNLSEPTSSCKLQLLFDLTGAKVWTAKDSLVKVTYRNTYTNEYFGIVQKVGVQDFDVKVEPLETAQSPTTN